MAVEERDASKQGGIFDGMNLAQKSLSYLVEQRGDEDSNIMFVGSQNSVHALI